MAARQVDERTRQLQAASTAIVTKHAEDPKRDIIEERKKASFDSKELCYYLNGGKEKVERRWVRRYVLFNTLKQSWILSDQPATSMACWQCPNGCMTLAAVAASCHPLQASCMHAAALLR